MSIKDYWKPFTITRYDVEDPDGWAIVQKFPVWIERDAEITICGPFMFTRGAIAPGFSKNWGSKLTRLKFFKTYPKLARRVKELETKLYVKDNGARLYPFVWFIRTVPMFTPRCQLVTFDEYLEFRKDQS